MNKRKKVEKFTPELLWELFEMTREKYKNSGPNDSNPKALFLENGKFNENNWNSGQNLIELFTHGYVWDFQGGTFIEDILLDGEWASELIAHTDFCDDDWYSTIIIADLNSDSHDLYFLNHYKSRGNINMIKKNGNPISINEYCELLNLLNHINGHSYFVYEDGAYAFK